MTIKEAPLIKAASKTGPIKLPGGPFWSGLLSVYASAVFGGFGCLFFIILLSEGYPLEIVALNLGGIIVCLFFTFMVHIGVLFVAIFGNQQERKNCFQYLLGSLFGYVSFAVILYFTLDPLYDWLKNYNNIFIPSTIGLPPNSVG